LSDFKGKSAAEMFSLGLGEGGGAWKWRRQLFAWEEEMVEDCRDILLGVSLQVNNLDEWKWLPNQRDGYTIRGVYQFLAHQEDHTLDTVLESVWHTQVPLKVSIYA